jgi:hypothetical protein
MSDSDIYKFFNESPYNSVKVSSYFDVYEDLFAKYRGKPLTFVEVGVLDGGSLFMWRNYFGPQARIIGIDFNPQAQRLSSDGFEIFIGNQADPNFWLDFFAVVGEVDILLDDGGHTYEQQITTAIHGIAHIANGGFLVIEDTCTSYMSDFGYPTKYSFIEWAKKKVDLINLRFECRDQSKLGDFGILVKSILFFESIVAFKIDRNLSSSTTNIENGNLRFGAEDFRYFDKVSDEIKLMNTTYMPKLVFRISMKVIRLFRRLILPIRVRVSLLRLRKFF